MGGRKGLTARNVLLNLLAQGTQADVARVVDALMKAIAIHTDVINQLSGVEQVGSFEDRVVDLHEQMADAVLQELINGEDGSSHRKAQGGEYDEEQQ
jgi:hypothetical protein